MKQTVGLLVTLAVLALAGCGAPDPVPTAAASSSGAPGAIDRPAESGQSTPLSGNRAKRAAYNAADVMFLQMMVSQERRTAELIETVRGRSVTASTRDLTAAIRATQADEADSMVAWLRERKQAVKADRDPERHSHHGGLTTLTTLTAADLAELRRARGNEFERAMLNILIGQQHAAIELARTSAATAGDPWVKELARRVDRSRTAEVAEMLRMVAAIPAR